jgi:DNA-binding response OmpR family regulator
MPKIMFVEDDNALRSIYKTRLQAEGYTVIPAADGEEALALAKADKPDLVIADIMMPKVSGLEMLDIMRNTRGLEDVKVIMLTALGQGEDEKRAKELGADLYFVKSQVAFEDIVAAARKLLGESAPDKPGPTPGPAPSAPSAPSTPSQ